MHYYSPLYYEHLSVSIKSMLTRALCLAHWTAPFFHENRVLVLSILAFNQVSASVVHCRYDGQSFLTTTSELCFPFFIICTVCQLYDQKNYSNVLWEDFSSVQFVSVKPAMKQFLLEMKMV